MIKIAQVKKVREDLNLTHVVIFGIDENGTHHICTHGKTQRQAKQAAEAGNSLKKGLNWPEDLCNSKPLERICKNCSFWKIRNYNYSERIPHSFEGNCYFAPSLIKRVENDIACGNFEPNR